MTDAIYLLLNLTHHFGKERNEERKERKKERTVFIRSMFSTKVKSRNGGGVRTNNIVSNQLILFYFKSKNPY